MNGAGLLGRNRVLALAALLVIVLVNVNCETEDDDDTADPMMSAQTMRRVIATDKAPAAIGPYSQAIQVGNLLFLAAQIGIDPATGQLVEGVEAQTRQVLTNLGAVLEAAEFSFGDVVQAQVFLADLDDYAAMNAVYAEFFGTGPPARAAIQAARIPRDARVEILLTAAR